MKSRIRDEGARREKLGCRETESRGILVGEGRGFWRAILSSVSPQEQLNEHRVCK